MEVEVQQAMDDHVDGDAKIICQNGTACKACIPCAFKVLFNYNLNSTAFTDLYMAYQYVE